MNETEGQDWEKHLEFADVLNFVYVLPGDEKKLQLIKFVSLGGKVYRRTHEGDCYAYLPGTERGKGATGDTPQDAAYNLMVQM